MTQTITLTVTLEIGGNNAAAAIAKIDELLPDRNGLVAAGIAGVVVRRLCRCGLIGSHPDGWHIDNADVRIQ